MALPEGDMNKLKIWVDFDPDVVNTSWMRDLFTSSECYDYLEKRIPDHEEAISTAEKMDIVVNTYHKFSATDIERMTKGNVKFLMRYGTGYENIDVAAATAAGLPFANTPGANAQTVAEIALLHILNCGRNFIKSYDAFKNERKWPGNFSGYELEGKTLGLMGFGNIARHLARLISGFRTDIVAYDPYLNEAGKAFAAERNVKIVETPEELFRISDVVSIHLPVTDSTRKSIGRKLFDVAKPGMILVNTSRGAVIDEDDLADALRKGQVGSAGLDVMAKEPPEEDNPLLAMENVYITSHTAGSSQEAEMRTQKLLFSTVEAFRNGTLADNVINRKQILEKKNNGACK